jgi:hypothetical protein
MNHKGKSNLRFAGETGGDADLFAGPAPLKYFDVAFIAKAVYTPMYSNKPPLNT